MFRKKFQIRDVHLGSQFPAIKGISVKDVQINREHQHIDTLDLCLDLEYSGGFQLSIDANMLLGKTAYLAIKGIFFYYFPFIKFKLLNIKF